MGERPRRAAGSADCSPAAARSRASARTIGDQAGLLLAGRASRAGRPDAPVAHQQVAAMRADRRRAGLGVVATLRRERLDEARLGIERRAARPASPRPRPRGASSGWGSQPGACARAAGELPDRLSSRGRDRDTGGRGSALQRAEPGGLEAARAQQAGALPERLAVARDRGRRAPDRRPGPGGRESAAEAPAPSLSSRSMAGVSQTTLGNLGERRLARRRGAVDPDQAPLALAVLDPCRSRDRSARAGPRAAPSRSRGRRRRSGRPRRDGRGADRAPGVRNEIASRRLVLPAPLGPVSTTGRGSVSRRRLR